jgi:hypothetical protein
MISIPTLLQAQKIDSTRFRVKIIKKLKPGDIKVIPGSLKSYTQVTIPARRDYVEPKPDTGVGTGDIVWHTGNGPAWKDLAVFTRRSDSVGAPWIQEQPGDDSATIVKGLLNMIVLNNKNWGAELHQKDSLLTRMDSIANRWVNVCRWMCNDFGITREQFMQVLRKYGQKSVNLNNKKQKHKL